MQYVIKNKRRQGNFVYPVFYQKILIVFLVMLILGCFVEKTFAQERNTTKHLNYKIGYQHYPWMGDRGVNYSNDKLKTFTPVAYFEVNYLLMKYLEVGLYTGFSLYRKVDGIEQLDTIAELNNNELWTFDGIDTYGELKSLFLFGINCNLQLLPLIFKRDVSFVDIYLSSKLGGTYFVDKTKSIYANKRPFLDYGLYGGMALYPGQHWGLYAEYGISNYAKWKAGVNLRF